MAFAIRIGLAAEAPSYPLIEGVSLGSAFNGGRMIGEQAAELAKAR